jgi:phosphatidylserine decarboxylase
METELVYGENWLRWLYESRTGQILADTLLSRAWISKVYGAYQSSGISARKVPSFVRNFSIPLEEYEQQRYSSFNEFFIRKFKPGVRKFPDAPSEMGSCAEGRVLAYAEVAPQTSVPIKGTVLTVDSLLSNFEYARMFSGGPAFVIRLCPTDYHRFHFQDQGQTLEHYRMSGRLHSVNPVALHYDPKILVTNERQVSILETENFGRLAYIEVGALCVGKIVQTHSPLLGFKRGDEKGYFLFGGSTVVLVGEKGRWTPEPDLLERSLAGIESRVRLGETIARART